MENAKVRVTVSKNSIIMLYEDLRKSNARLRYGNARLLYGNGQLRYGNAAVRQMDKIDRNTV